MAQPMALDAVAVAAVAPATRAVSTRVITPKPVTTTTAAPKPATVAPTTTRTRSPVPAPAPAPSVLFGVATENGPQDLKTFNADAGKPVSLYSYYDSFAFDSDFDASAAAALTAQHIQPMITWEPWDPSSGSATQPQYTLAAIAGGTYDAYITRWANEIKAWGQPLLLRFAHEMNGNWYPWAEGVNGNTTGQYVAAFRHVHDLFSAAGVTNVKWVWSPNVLDGTGSPLAELYPGDNYVDWIAVDGYNWGATASWSSWQSPASVFGDTLTAVRQISHRPLMIGETASTEIGGSKAQWITNFFSFLASNPDIHAFVWFNLNKETDWRIESSASAQTAFRQGVSNSRYIAG